MPRLPDPPRPQAILDRAWEEYNKALNKWRHGSIANQEARALLLSAVERVDTALEYATDEEMRKKLYGARRAMSEAFDGIPDDEN